MIVKDEEEKEEKKEEDINFDLEKFFKDNNAPECINKLQKQDLFDAKIFFKAEIGTIESALDLKPEGKKHSLMKKIKDLREKF